MVGSVLKTIPKVVVIPSKIPASKTTVTQVSGRSRGTLNLMVKVLLQIKLPARRPWMMIGRRRCSTVHTSISRSRTSLQRATRTRWSSWLLFVCSAAAMQNSLAVEMLRDAASPRGIVTPAAVEASSYASFAATQGQIFSNQELAKNPFAMIAVTGFREGSSTSAPSALAVFAMSVQ